MDLRDAREMTCFVRLSRSQQDAMYETHGTMRASFTVDVHEIPEILRIWCTHNTHTHADILSSYSRDDTWHLAGRQADGRGVESVPNGLTTFWQSRVDWRHKDIKRIFLLQLLIYMKNRKNKRTARIHAYVFFDYCQRMPLMGTRSPQDDGAVPTLWGSILFGRQQRWTR